MPPPRGGARTGAGRPKGQGKYGEKTCPIRVPERLINEVQDWINNKTYINKWPLYSSKVAAGFPSPADDYIEKYLDLNEYLISHPASTFFVRATGQSMINAGIFDQDILIVDRSLDAVPGKIVVVAIDGELTVKRLIRQEDGYYLQPDNPDYPALKIRSDHHIHIWGVVVHVIHTL